MAVRIPRPYKKRMELNEPLVTGQRVGTGYYKDIFISLNSLMKA